MTVSEAIEQWIAYRKRLVALDLVRPSTWANQTKSAQAISTALGSIELADLRKSHIETQFMGVRMKTCRPITVQAEMNILRQFLNWCVDEQVLAEPPRFPTVKVPNVEKPLPPDAAFLFVLKHLPPRHALTNEFMMLTGLSPHEAARIQKRDFARPVGQGYGSIGIGKRPDFKVKQESRRRSVHLNQRAMEIWLKLTAGLEPTDHPFPSVYAMEKAIQRLRVTAKDAPPEILEITPKSMRSWFASKVAGDQPEHVLQKLMGHAPGSKITRKHYVKSQESALIDAVEGVRT